jgi:leukotriene-A4 hydrolase
MARTRLVAPVYRELVENGQDAALAQQIFSEARTGYHPLTVTRIESILASAESNR